MATATSTKIKSTLVLTGLERQRAFLDDVKKNKLAEDSFFVIDKVMEGMRDNGYRDIRKALNDLIDNGQQAGAKRIAVTSTTAKDEKKGKEKISSIAVIDDGHGMLPEMLPIAVKWGGTDRHGERDGL